MIEFPDLAYDRDNKTSTVIRPCEIEKHCNTSSLANKPPRGPDVGRLNRYREGFGCCDGHFMRKMLACWDENNYSRLIIPCLKILCC